jgi:hypothetical protein
MAVAERFMGAGEAQRVHWFTVRDNEGVIWRYQRTSSPIDPSALVHVRWENNGILFVPVLIRDDAGLPYLRQDGPGLPERIIVSFDDQPMRGTAGGTAAGGTGVMDGERVEFVQAQG